MVIPLFATPAVALAGIPFHTNLVVFPETTNTGVLVPVYDALVAVRVRLPAVTKVAEIDTVPEARVTLAG